jgi:membrane-associated phospholipid phosphatase
MKTLTMPSSAKSILSRLARKQFATPFNLAMGLILAVLIVADVVLSRTVHLTGLSVFLEIWSGVLLLIGCLCYCILRPLPRLIESVELIIWAVLLNNVLSPLILIAGRSPRPLIDHSLCVIDGGMHFSTEFIVHLAAQAPVLRVALAFTYPVLGPLVIIAILALPVFGHADAARRYILGTTLAVILTSAIFALWPAAGPWTTENIGITKEQAGVTAYLMRLKSSVPVEVDLKDAAIVSFPSFHVALAILTAVAFGSFRRLRVWAWVLTVLICISTITTGWHYGIDLLGGIVVAVVSIAAAGQIKERPNSGCIVEADRNPAAEG